MLSARGITRSRVAWSQAMRWSCLLSVCMRVAVRMGTRVLAGAAAGVGAAGAGAGDGLATAV